MLYHTRTALRTNTKSYHDDGPRALLTPCQRVRAYALARAALACARGVFFFSQELKKMQPACQGADPTESSTCHQWTSLLSDKVGYVKETPRVTTKHHV